MVSVLAFVPTDVELTCRVVVMLVMSGLTMVWVSGIVPVVADMVVVNAVVNVKLGEVLLVMLAIELIVEVVLLNLMAATLVVGSPVVLLLLALVIALVVVLALGKVVNVTLVVGSALVEEVLLGNAMVAAIDVGSPVAVVVVVLVKRKMLVLLVLIGFSQRAYSGNLAEYACLSFKIMS